MLGTAHPRGPGVEVGQELEAVKMPPRPLLGVVIRRQFPVTLRTAPASAPRMAGPHIDPTLLDGQLDPAHVPWRLEPQHLAVQLGVSHGRIMPPTASSGHVATHEEPGSAKILNNITTPYQQPLHRGVTAV